MLTWAGEPSLRHQLIGKKQMLHAHHTLYLTVFCLVRQLHREFLRAGSDVIQAFTFTMDDDLGGEHAKHGVGIISLLCFNSYTVLLRPPQKHADHEY